MTTDAKQIRDPSFDGSLTAELVSLIRNKPVAQEDMDAMALFALDGVANMLAGRRSVPGEKLLAYLKGREGDTGRRALVMGGLTHILEVDDLHKASVVHPACVTIPAAIALAQDSMPSGEEFLRAILYGFEACTRVGMAVGKAHYKIWHNTATCGTFGGAMTAATLLGLTDEETVHALGNAGTQSSGLWEFLNTGAMSKHLHAGRGAEAGIVSAQLAQLGFTGPPAILEGPQGLFAGACPDPDPGAVLRAPDEPWQVHKTSIKPWPSCRHTHPVIDAAIELSGKIDIDNIESVDVAAYQAAIDVCDRPVPESEYEAKFSLQHCVGISLMDGKNEFASYDLTSRDRAAELRKLISVRAGENYTAAYPEDWGGEVTVNLKCGGSVTAVRNACKGDPELPLNRDEMIAKARELLSFAAINDVDAVVDGVLDMANGGALPGFSLQ
ncbi:MAG: MmgE/PrpD family protein [Rhodospirillaceae bacterium]|nr:MAG: MmgE/PrpD family protein [Rhodospirillaceae bacterium]